MFDYHLFSQMDYHSHQNNPLFDQFPQIEFRPALGKRPSWMELETMALHFGTRGLSFGNICIQKSHWMKMQTTDIHPFAS